MAIDQKKQNLYEIGSKVKVRLNKVGDRLPEDTFNIIKSESEGTVNGYKMTDGNGIGIIVKLNNGEKLWFFDQEITLLGEEKSLNDLDLLETHNKFIEAKINRKEYRTSSKINQILNPINFINWLMYSSSDIF